MTDRRAGTSLRAEGENLPLKVPKRADGQNNPMEVRWAENLNPVFRHVPTERIRITRGPQFDFGDGQAMLGLMESKEDISKRWVREGF